MGSARAPAALLLACPQQVIHLHRHQYVVRRRTGEYQRRPVGRESGAGIVHWRLRHHAYVAAAHRNRGGPQLGFYIVSEPNDWASVTAGFPALLEAQPDFLDRPSNWQAHADNILTEIAVN